MFFKNGSGIYLDIILHHFISHLHQDSPTFSKGPVWSFGGAWTGGCHSCVSSYGAHSCNVLIHRPNLDAARDDFMSTGFVPSQISWPLVVNVTHVAGEDFKPSVICPPQDPDAKSAPRLGFSNH